MQRRHHPEKHLSFENLESRVVLSADGALPLSDPFESSTVVENSQVNDSELATVAQPAVITGLQLRINGDQLVTVDSAFDSVRLRPGDRLEVLGADFEIHESFTDQVGIVALEAYVSKLPLGHGAATPDFSDGRFSVPGTNPEFAVGVGRLAAAEGGWLVEEGWDRLTLSMVHYHGDQADQVAGFAIQLQVGDPDFTMDPAVLDQFHHQFYYAGDTVPVWGAFMNQGSGRYHNYWEVDVYRDGEEQPAWVGVSVGNTSRDAPLKSEMLHPVTGGWTPEEAGDYVLRFYADPENTWQELAEDNNHFEVRVTISDTNEDGATKAVADKFTDVSPSTRLDVLANDSHAPENAIEIVAYSQGANGRVSLKRDGTLRYKPNNGFAGKDSFQYEIVDALGATSKAEVRVFVSAKGKSRLPVEKDLIAASEAPAEVAIQVVNEIVTTTHQTLNLEISLDPTRFDGVLVTGLPPRDVTVLGGTSRADGSVYLSSEQLDDAQFVSHRRIRAGELVFTPMRGDEAIRDLSVSTPVVVESDADGERLQRRRTSLRAPLHSQVQEDAHDEAFIAEGSVDPEGK